MMAQPWLLDGVILTAFLTMVVVIAAYVLDARYGQGERPDIPPPPKDSERAATAKILLADWDRRFSDRYPSSPSDPLPSPEIEDAVRRLSRTIMVRKSTLREYYRDMGRLPETAGDIRSWYISDIRLGRIRQQMQGRYDRD